jgi:hypothetical protein
VIGTNDGQTIIDQGQVKQPTIENGSDGNPDDVVIVDNTPSSHQENEIIETVIAEVTIETTIPSENVAVVNIPIDQ